MGSAGKSPTDDELKQILVALRAENPTLGVPKLHALLATRQPDWTVSEKRTRKILQSAGLVLTPSSAQTVGAGQDGAERREIHPSSHVIEGLDVAKWTKKVEVKYFNKRKGKGLVATEKISEGETIWKEDPFILAPEWNLYDLQIASRACMHCSTPLKDSVLVVTCPASSSKTPCPARFCSRLCLSRSSRTHPLLCAAQNPASAPLLAFARRAEWMALHALAQCTARVLMTCQQDEAAWQDDWEFVRALAQLGMEERAKGAWMKGREPDRETWKKAFRLYVQAFREPLGAAEQQKLARLLRKPLKQEIIDHFFNYDAFLLGLGRMSLNLEAHGGLYVLHSHVNHSCAPNVSARHLDQRNALSRINMIARREVEPGEEIFITYVNPELPVHQRRLEIQEWGFDCNCTRCVEELKAASHTEHTESGMEDLERELKAGLGVM
ncbi:SET domain-containing protein [Wolfiporia cocos MD-104 SS10]|uniref:Histone-lysine N-methyltransferase SET5 n=1 Tax=Wolfiporia cocos (strain MD-104) TaxID=742152 RepID=A0A2H3JZ60_WOLCO|nr:SET domain-containing protein [Wolfiporia cocos MD-104 SS10]